MIAEPFYFWLGVAGALEVWISGPKVYTFRGRLRRRKFGAALRDLVGMVICYGIAIRFIVIGINGP